MSPLLRIVLALLLCLNVGLGILDAFIPPNSAQASDTEPTHSPTIFPNVAPNADFSCTPQSGEEPLDVIFSDLSTSEDGLTSWNWDFGDGQASTEQNPTHQYTQEGTYTVSLTVTEADGDSDTETKASYISVDNTVPSADFSGAPQSGAKPLDVTFSDLSASNDGIISWSWDFGDGQTSTEQNPTHRYAQDGTYTVSLTVTEADSDSDTETKASYISVDNTVPSADFSGAPQSGAEPLDIIFSNLSASNEGIISWSWDFGDGQTSTEKNPFHQYTQEGTYTVSLTVTEADSDNDTETKDSYISVADKDPISDFSATPMSANKPAEVTFTDRSTSYDGITSWSWDFGDGQTSTEQNPTHQYTQDGTYTVSLTVTEADGDSDTELKAGYIMFPSMAPSADFSCAPQGGVEPLDVIFSDLSTSQDGIISWSWDFGDGRTSAEQNPSHQYAQDGSYTVSLTITEADSDSDTEGKAGYITVADAGPEGKFSAAPLSGSEPLEVTFTDESTSYDGITSWSWDFGDGQTSTEQNPSHRYAQDGTYTVSLTVSEADGASDTETKDSYITVGSASLFADFSATPLDGNEPVEVTFTDKSSSYDGITSWVWDFGDGQTSTEQNPTHRYAQDGTYTVSLTITEPDGDSDSETKADYITAADLNPTADFSGAPQSGVKPLDVTFTDQSISYDGIKSWSWDFGDGQTSTDQSPTHRYAQNGSYTVSLTIREADGDSDIHTKSDYIAVPGTGRTADFSKVGSDLKFTVHADGTISVDDGIDPAYTLPGTENIIISSGENTIVFEDGAFLNGWISGAGTVALDYSACSTDIIVDLASGSATGLHSVSSVSRVIGGSGNDTLMGPADNATWYITGPDSGRVGGVTFSGIENLTGAADNEDTFVFQNGGSLSGVAEGGAGGFDSVVIEGGPYNSVSFEYTDFNSGIINLDGTIITYSGLEPIVDNTDTNNRIYTANDGAQTITIGDNGNSTDTLSKVAAETPYEPYEPYDFAPPWISLTVNADSDDPSGDGDDTIIVNALDPDFDVHGASFTIYAGDGNDQITFDGTQDVDGVAGEDHITDAITVYGDAGNDTYSFKDHWGNITITPGAGNDTLDFSDYTGNITLAIDGSGDLIITGTADTTTDPEKITIQATDIQYFQDILGANIDLSGSLGTQLKTGLQNMVEYSRSLADYGNFSTSLPLIGNYADVTVAKALDFAEAIDELRLEVEEFVDNAPFKTTDELMAKLDAIFGDAGRTLEYLGPAILSPNAITDDVIYSSDSYGFRIKIDDSTTYTLGSVTGVTSIDDLVAGINAELLTATSGKIDAVQRDGRIAFQAVDTELKNFSVEGLGASNTKLGFEDGEAILLDNIQDMLRDLGPLNLSLANAISLDVDLSSGTPTLRFGVDYQGNRTSDFCYNLGDQGRQLGVAIDLNARLTATAKMVFDFELGVSLGSGGVDFFFDVNQLSAGILLDTTAVNGLKLNIGFLGATANGTLALDAGVKLNAPPKGIDPSTGFDPAALGGLQVTNYAGNSDPNFNVDLNIGATLGSTFTGSGGLTAYGNPFDPGSITFSGDTNFNANFPDFNNLGAAGVVSLVASLASWFDGLRTSDLIGSIGIPFVSGGLDQVLDLAEVVSDALLFNDGADDVKDGEYKLVTDLNNALASAGLDRWIRAQGDGRQITLLAVDPTASFAIKTNAKDDGGLADLGFGNTTATGSITGSSILNNLGKIFGNAGFTVEIGSFARDVMLTKDATDTNTGIGDDVAKLVDAFNAPTFATAQELAARLAELDPMSTVEYDPTTKVLTYPITFSDITLFSVELPTDFALDLSPLGNVASDTRLIIDANGGLNLTLGFDLSELPGGSKKLTNDTTLEELGVKVKTEQAVAADSKPREEAREEIPGQELPPLIGRLTNDATFDIAFDPFDTPHTLAVTVKKADADNNTNILDLTLDVQKAIDAAIESSSTLDGYSISVTTEKGRLLFTNNSTTHPDAFRIHPGSNADQLGITSPELPSSLADMIITLSDGSSYPVTLDDVTDIGNVTYAIGNSTAWKVVASRTVDDPTGEATPVDETDTGLTLVDTTFSGTPIGNFTVDMVNGSLAVMQLGILGVDKNPLDEDDVADGKIIGAQIGGATLLDRFFIPSDDLTDIANASLSVRAGIVVKNIEIVGEDGGNSIITSTPFNFSDSFVGSNLTIKNVAGFNAGQYQINSVTRVGNQGNVTISGSVGQVGQVGGVGIIDTGVRALANFGFVGIGLDGTADLGASIAVGFNPNADEIEDDKLTLRELIDGLGNITHIMALPDLQPQEGKTDFGGLDLSVALMAGSADFNSLAAGLLGADPSIGIQVITWGDPFIGTRFEQANYLKLSDTQFRLDGDFTAKLPGNVTLRFAYTEDGENLVEEMKLTEILYAAGETTVTVEPVDPESDFVLPGSLDGYDLTLMPKVELHYTDLDDLLDLSDLGFEEIIKALRALFAFLSQFEDTGFLNKPIPIIDKSVNELLGFADRLLDAIEEAEKNPAGTLQFLEDKIKESIGIDLGSLLEIQKVIDNGYIPDDVFNLGWDKNARMLTFDFAVGTSFSRGLDINLGNITFGDALSQLGCESILNLSGRAGLSASGAVLLRLKMGVDVINFVENFDIGRPFKDIYIFDETGLDAQLTVGGEDIAFRLGLGPFALSIASASDSEKSSIMIDGKAKADFKAAGGNATVEDILGDVTSYFDGNLTGTGSGTLPVFFPNDTTRFGTIKIGECFGAGYGNLLNIGNTIIKTGNETPSTGSFVIDVSEIVEKIKNFDFTKLSLFDIIFLAVDGIDLTLETVGDVIDGEMGGITIPLIGDDLAKGAVFIDDLREDFIAPLREMVEKAEGMAQDFAGNDTNFISKAIFNLLGPNGADLLKQRENATEPYDSPSDYIYLETNYDHYLFNIDPVPAELKDVYIQWDMTLFGDITNLSTDIGFDIGIPGLGLKTEGDINLDIKWELDFGFGLDFQNGFYLMIDDPHELLFDVSVTLPASITGTLGFLALTAEDKELDFSVSGDGSDMHSTALGATFKANIYEKGATGDDAKRLGFSEFGSIGIDAGIAAQASAALDMTLGLTPDIATGFPEVEGEFRFLWGLGERNEGTLEQLGTSTFIGFNDILDSIEDGLKLISFGNITLDVGSFLSDVLGPIVNEVSKFTEPIRPLVDFVASPVPIIGELGLDITWLDLAQAYAGDKVDFRYINYIAQLVTLTSDIAEGGDAGDVKLPIGDFTVFDDRDGAEINFTELLDSGFNLDETFKQAQKVVGIIDDLIGDAGGIGEALSDLIGEVGDPADTLQKVVGGSSAGGFTFPFLKDPMQVFGLLMGKPATLVSYDLAPLVFTYDWYQFFSIYGPLGVSIELNVKFQADTAFGYDTQGISDFVKTGFRNPLLLLNGFYINDSPQNNGKDDPELLFSTALTAAAELNLGIARAGVAGELTFEIRFDLFDPNHDMKIRLTELYLNFMNQLRSDEPWLAPLAIFDVSGGIYARLFLFLVIDFGLFSFEEEFPIYGPVTLLDFSIDFYRPPILASELDNGDLLINTGAFANQRLLGNAKDVSEFIKIKSNGSDDGHVKVQVKSGNDALGDDSQNWQDYEVKKGGKIVIDGGEGNDKFDLTGFTESDVIFDIDLGAGNDQVLWGNESKGIAEKFTVIKGGAGDDDIEGSGGSDLIYGGLGNDKICANDGGDLVFGDEGDIGTDSVRCEVSPIDGRDYIEGGDGEDILIGGGGKDEIHGGAGPNLILGGGGAIFFNSSSDFKVFKNVKPPGTGGVKDTVNSLDMSAGDVITGSPGMDIIYGTDGPDTITGTDGNDIIIGGLGNDTIDGLGGNDIIFGDGDESQIAEHAAGNGTSSSGNSTNLKVLSGGNFLTIDVSEYVYVWNDTEHVFVRVTKVISDNEVETEPVTDWTGDKYSFFVPEPADGGAPDVIQGNDGDDLIFGCGGADQIQGGDGDDVIFGGSGPDIIFGDNGHVDGSILVADSGNGTDKIYGQGEPDKIQGCAGSDKIDGGAGPDVVRGGDDSDVLYFYAGADSLDGQEGGDFYMTGFRGGSEASLAIVHDEGTLGTDSLIVNGTIQDDQILLRANNDGSEAFVASINQNYNVERINYDNTIESIVVNGDLGDDWFAVDDTSAEVTLNGELGNDKFQIGQLFRSQRTAAAGNIPVTPFDDQFATIETTRGFLSNGISEPMTCNGGAGNDTFVVYHNRAVLQLNGGDDDDEFRVKSFALVGSQEPQRERTDISGGAGADFVEYAVNAPVNIDGGDGFDTVVVIGTEFGDDYVITESGVYGGGLNVNFVNIECLQVDGAEGDDRFYVKSTSEKFVTQIMGGLGSDTFNMSGDTPPVVSNDLLGHSGIILHDVESVDPLFDGQKLFGVSTNVADNDEPFAVIRQTEGSTIITEGSSTCDSYEIVLTRQPDPNKPVSIYVLAPFPTPDQRDKGELSFRVESPTALEPLEQNGRSLTLQFTSSDWFVPQEVRVYADNKELTDIAGLFTRPELPAITPPEIHVKGTFKMDDSALEGIHFGVVNHVVRAASDTIEGPLLDIGDGHITATIADPVVVEAGDLIGLKLFVTEGPGTGQSRIIVAVDDTTQPGNFTLTFNRAFSETALPDDTSHYSIGIDDAIVGKMTGFDEEPGMSLPGTDPAIELSTFTDSAAAFPTVGEGLRGATLQIVGGPGAGQQRLILGHVAGNETTSLILNGPWRTKPVAGESIYRIERFDGLQIPSVKVQINDDDRAGLIIDETKGFKNDEVVADVSTVTAVIEDGDGDQLGEKDVVQVRLSHQPADTVVVDLLGTGTQLSLKNTSGTEISSLEFTDSDWSTFKPVVVSALHDLLREGFHTSLIDFQIPQSNIGNYAIDGNRTKADHTDEINTKLIPGKEDGVSYVGLSHKPIEGSVSSVTLDSAPLTEADSNGLNGDYIVLSNKVIFVDGTGAKRNDVIGIIKVTYDYNVPGFDTVPLPPVLARISDADAPTVLVRETGGSTDVIEVKKGGSAPESIPFSQDTEKSPWIDSYELVLTAMPTGNVTVHVTPDITKTTRTGGIRHDEVQVQVSSLDSRVMQVGGNLTVTFDETNWNEPVVIKVKAIDDSFVDGSDTQVFAPGPNTLSGILGPVIVQGAAGGGSLGIERVLMLPGETNVKEKTGDVVSVSGTQVTVLTGNLTAILGEFELGNVSELVEKTLEITVTARPDKEPDDPENLYHSAIGQFRMIVNVAPGEEQTVLTINEPYVLNIGNNTGEQESDIKSYAITAESLNFFVNEAEQIDYMFLYDEDSPADSSGNLTATQIQGLNMGPDIEIAGRPFYGGITYEDLEVLEINLGTGFNNFTVLGTHTRPGNQTWTFLNTGNDILDPNQPLVKGDTVTVKLQAGVDGPLAINLQDGDDTVDASGSTLGIVVFGGSGNDTITGGNGTDIIFGDRGRVEYFKEDGELVTRLGLIRDETLDNGQPNNGFVDVPVAAGNSTLTDYDIEFPTEDEGLAGLIVNIINGAGGPVRGEPAPRRLIVGNNEHTLTVDKPWDRALDTTSEYRISFVPEDQTDLVVRDPLLLMTNHLDIAGNDTLRGGPGDDVLIGGSGNDAIDGSSGEDLIFADNVKLDRRDFSTGNVTMSEDYTNPRFRALEGSLIYDEDDVDKVNDLIDYEDPKGVPHWANWNILISELERFNAYGNDYIAGGADDDMIFGQLGNDTIQGDGSIESALVAAPCGAYRDAQGLLIVVPSFEQPSSDGNDYIEGNGGNDTIFGNLGQDDIIGGSSDLFSLDTPTLRPDGNDTIFGGAGNETDIARNSVGDGSHTQDADMILGDNGDIFRLVDDVSGQYLTFNYDNYGSNKIVPRAARLLDYTAGGFDYETNLGEVENDIGSADEIHGESGDDFIYGMKDEDVIFGEGQDDDIIGGYGNDWISGGTGQDGILGDDGRIYTSRNGTAEPLYGIGNLAGQLDQFIYTPGKIQQSTINVEEELKKTVNITPFKLGAPEDLDYATQDPVYADDVIYGGWGDDFIHGCAGDDAISGAEALDEYYDAPFNPGDVLRFGDYRAGEFGAYNEYDPWSKVYWNPNTGEFVPNPTEETPEFLLNFNPGEGPLDSYGGGVTGYDQVPTDGDDVIFGDLGNDWLVGGTGKDHLYGGYGSDLLNADDDQGTNDGTNDEFDTHPSYEDIAYGGAGRDYIIGNTGGDRLIDWAGEFNSYIVPFSPFGTATVSRTLQPQLQEYLYALSKSDGADPTRVADTGADPLRNGEPKGELGLVRQQDFEWKDQTGAPDDPQPGNIPGGNRDMLRSATFDGVQGSSLDGFFVDSGVWQIQGGALCVAAESLGGDAAAVFYVDKALPTYFEIQASITMEKPLAGWKSNAYIIFDYYSQTDFKFAGLNAAINKIQIGHRTSAGWIVDTQANMQIKPGVYYNILLAVNGTTVTVLANNQNYFSYTFKPRVIDGYAYNINAGMVGFGSDNSKGVYDNMVVQVLPPQITFKGTEGFPNTDPTIGFFPIVGLWQYNAGRYEAALVAGQDSAISQADLGLKNGLEVTSILQLQTMFSTKAVGGLVFDYYAPDWFKFAAIDANAGKAVIGHYTQKSGWVYDATYSIAIKAGVDYDMALSLAGTTANLSLKQTGDKNWKAIVGYVFNAVTVDGAFGLISRNGTSSFDTVTISTNDSAFRK